MVGKDRRSTDDRLTRRRLTCQPFPTPNLTLSEADGQVEIRVRYEVTFDAFDRALAELGRNWHSHVNVHGFDGGDELGADIPAAVFDRVDFDVNAGTTGPSLKT